MELDANTTPPWDLSDDKLLQACRFEALGTGGPGGQHRNRTYTAVRITHLPTRVSAIAQDSRSQRENRIHALRHLRHKLALTLRREVDLRSFTPPAYLSGYPGLKMSEKNPLYPRTVALVVDLLKATHWNVHDSAIMLGVSTSALMRFMHEDGALWQHVQNTLAQLGMKPIKRER